MLELKYTDKYQLWNDLVHGSTDRLFVPSDETLKSGSQVPIQVHVADEALPVVALGTVVGRRNQSRRFARGVFVQITPKELEKLRGYLGLDPADSLPESPPRALRVHHAFTVRFLEPALDGVFTTKNISDSLLFVACNAELSTGSKVRISLELEDGPLELIAQVAWASLDQGAAGLHLVAPSETALARLRAAITAVLDSQAPTLTPILVADDDADILKFISTALSKSGYEVFHSSSGEDTMRMVRELHPALVVMDLLMPGIDGAEICKAMRADADLADIPVIFVSALAPEVLHDVADSSGATDYLTKPMHLKELLEVVEHYLGE